MTIKLRGPGPDVFYADDPLPLLERADIDRLKDVVDRTSFKRNRICVHRDTADALQEMFIVQSQATYIRPHKHIGKVESLLVLEGEADAVFFDETGDITSSVRLADYRSGRSFFYRIGEGVYHSLVIRTPLFIFKEATLGPFDKAQTVFAPWSPDERDEAGGRAYIATLDTRVQTGAWRPR